MKVIGLEEHLAPVSTIALWESQDERLLDPTVASWKAPIRERLGEWGEKRIAAMRDTGVDVQVLSLPPPGAQTIDPAQAAVLARSTNNLIADAVRDHPADFQGWATLPTAVPDEAAPELRRAVTDLGLKDALLCGRTDERNLDAAEFRSLFAAATDLEVPLYIHPQVPQRAVRRTYYEGFGDSLDFALSTAGIGWHYETGMQFLRLVLAGTFDRHPELQIVLGHWGEVVLFFLERVDELSAVARHLDHPVSHYFRNNLYVTPSGIFSQRYLRWSIDVLGSERVMFSTDFPFQFASGGGARSFLSDANLSVHERDLVASGNWERLTR